MSSWLEVVRLIVLILAVVAGFTFFILSFNYNETTLGFVAVLILLYTCIAFFCTKTQLIIGGLAILCIFMAILSAQSDPPAWLLAQCIIFSIIGAAAVLLAPVQPSWPPILGTYIVLGILAVAGLGLLIAYFVGFYSKNETELNIPIMAWFAILVIVVVYVYTSIQTAIARANQPRRRAPPIKGKGPDAVVIEGLRSTDPTIVITSIPGKDSIDSTLLIQNPGARTSSEVGPNGVGAPGKTGPTGATGTIRFPIKLCKRSNACCPRGPIRLKLPRMTPTGITGITGPTGPRGPVGL